MRRLARSLVRDHASADDLEQEAALAALRLEAPPAALRLWLGRVTRNLARRAWRERAHRAARERAYARPERLPGPDESVARLELQQRLLAQVAALDPALRHACVRRYLDGWSAARIARETGEPAATVRWRLRRALTELRARLDRLSGSDGVEWRLALLPLCRGPLGDVLEFLRPLTGASAIPGALTMKATLQALTAGALATTLGIGAWWTMGREVESRVPSSREAPANPPELAQPPAPAEVSGPPAEAQREVAAEPPPAPRLAEMAPTQAVAARATGRCVDHDLVPIGFARVSQVRHGVAAEAGADGAFTLALESQRGAATLLVEAAGYASRFLELTVPAAGTVPLGDVVLAPGGAVRGCVLGPAGGPFAGASISVTGPDLMMRTLERVRVEGPTDANLLASVSGPDGRFEVAGLAPGPVRVWAGAEGMRYAVSAPVEVRARAASDEVELVLEPLQRVDRITGILLSPAGEPVPAARLEGMERQGGGGASVAYVTGDDGRFEIESKARHVYDLLAVDPEGRWAHVPAKGLVPGTHELVLRFQEARWIEIEVRAPKGEALGSCLVTADGGDDGWLERVAVEPNAGGRARLRVPALPFTVLAEARGFTQAAEGPFMPEEAPAGLVLELAPEPGVRGHVLADGRPLAGARVTLHRYDSGSRIDVQGYDSLVSPHPRDETATGADGAFTLHLRRAGTYLVRAEAEGWAARESERMELDPRDGRAGVELVLGPGGVLEGRVLVAPGRDPSGVVVAVNRGDARPHTVRSSADGSFRFEGLMAGPWHLLRGGQEFNPAGHGSSFSSARTPTVIPFNCTIRDGETTWQDLDLRDYEPCVVRGVLLVNGAPARDWGVAAWPGGKEAVTGTPLSTSVAADGDFTLAVDQPGLLRLTFSPPLEAGGNGRLTLETEVVPGVNEWRADLGLGRLNGRLLTPPAAGDALFYTAAEGVAPACWLMLAPDEDGRFVLPFVPAGRGTIKRYSNDAWETLAEAEVVARAERELDVP
jgi:RNA polymerase sigma factor (sigma-70 family)